MNLKLKSAITTSGKHQYEIARLVGISENQLTQIVTRRRTATYKERRALSRVLKIAEKVLFEEAE